MYFYGENSLIVPEYDVKLRANIYYADDNKYNSSVSYFTKFIDTCITKFSID